MFNEHIVDDNDGHDDSLKNSKCQRGFFIYFFFFVLMGGAHEIYNHESNKINLTRINFF